MYIALVFIDGEKWLSGVLANYNGHVISYFAGQYTQAKIMAFKTKKEAKTEIDRYKRRIVRSYPYIARYDIRSRIMEIEIV